MNSQSNAKCANCQEYNLDCTYVEAAKRRGPPKGYIDTLEQRCARLERLVNQLNPAIDISETIGPMPDRDEFELSAYQETLRSLGVPPFPAMKNISELAATPPNGAGGGHNSPRVLGPAPWKTYERDPHRPPEDEDEAREQARIAHAMVKLNIRDHDAFRFHGKASGAHLVRIVNELKYNEADATFFDRLTAVKRPEYWMVPEWEKVIATESVKPVDYSVWPDEDLAGRLIDGYFDHTNTHMPLLNRVIFQRQYQSGLWRTNAEFAKMCLLVFANGARYVDDERVYWPTEVATTPEGQDRLRNDRDGTLKYSAGWNYLRAVIKMGRSWLQGPSLLDLQTTVLVCLFMNGSAVPHLAWLVAGSGLRMAQEIGIHVRSTMLLTNPIDRALYNRAFWCLYHFDRLSCSAIGRSVAIQDSDFDADYPIPVDDEYWDTGDPEKDFRQPPGLTPDPAVTAFTHLLKLDHVLGAALRTIYAVNKLPEHGPDQRAIVVELDSALNAWADSVPDNLRWDPTRSDPRLFEHSAVLYAHYYYVQILIHRPFIPTRKHPESVGFPSLAICSNAARSISNVLDAVLRRGRQLGRLPGHAMSISFALPAGTAAIVLLMNVYAVRQREQERQRCLNDVKRVIAAMKEMELTYRQAGKMTDLITEIARESTGDMPEALGGLPPKRGYEDVEPPVSTTPGAPDVAPWPAAVLEAKLQSEIGRSGSNFASPSSNYDPANAPPGPPTPPFIWSFNNSNQGTVPYGSTASASGSPAQTSAPQQPPPTSASQAVPPQNPVASLMGPNLGAPPTNAAGETIFPEFFDADNLHSMGFAVANFDMIAGNPGDQAPAPDFWTSLLRGSGPQGLGTFGGIGSNSGFYAGLPSERERQQPWNFMPWLGHQGDVNMAQAQAQANGPKGQGGPMGGQQQQQQQQPL